MHYDYRCANCKSGFVVDAPTTSHKQRISPSCPKCKSKNVVKLISKPNVIFKGAGWGKDKK